MIRFQHEQLTPALAGEMKPLLEEHYEEVALNKDKVKLDPKWSDYFALQFMDRFAMLTARDDSGRLVGYNAFFLNTHIHYGSLSVAVNDVFYLHPDTRRGATALRFLRWTRAALRELTPAGQPLKIAYHVKAGNNFGAILSRLGYTREEEVLAEIL